MYFHAHLTQITSTYQIYSPSNTFKMFPSSSLYSDSSLSLSTTGRKKFFVLFQAHYYQLPPTLNRKPHFLFPNFLKRWYFQKNRAGIWSFLCYRERWYVFFQKILSYPQTENERSSFSKIYTEIWYFFKRFEKMVFSKSTAPGMIFLVLYGKVGFFFLRTWYFFPGWKTREGWPFSRNTRKHYIFYLISSTLPCENKTKTILSHKNTPKGDWHSRSTP